MTTPNQAPSFEQATEIADSLVLQAAPDSFGQIDDCDFRSGKFVYTFEFGQVAFVDAATGKVQFHTIQ